MQLVTKMQRLQRQATKLRARPRTVPTNTTDSLNDFIAQTHGLEAPHHLAPLVRLFERIAAGDTVRALVSTPPQHGKSQTCLHALVWLLQRKPHLRHAYATYAQQFSRDQSTIAHRVVEHHGLQLDRGTLDRWSTPAGGGVVWTSRGGPLTGHPVDGVLLVDDLLKDREEAESPLIREKAMGWLTGVAFTRMHPSASVIVVATRWHPSDPTGQLIGQDEWDQVILPAIKEDGTALWPEQRPLDFLRKQEKRVGVYDWWSLYMCQPRPRGGALFRGEPARYDGPTTGKRITVTVDLAASEKKTADYTVLTAAAHWGSTNDDRGMDILKVERGQWDLAHIHEACHRWQAEYGVILDVNRVTQPQRLRTLRP